LIEIQKSNKLNPIIRFRRYVGKSYLKQETYIDANGVEQTRSLPIFTIYILGYKLEEYDTPAILVDNVVIDTVSSKTFSVKNNFVQLLTHPCYILQIKRLRPDRKTRIEKFLAIFDQDKKADSKFILNLDEDSGDNEINEIIDYLHLAVEDEEMIRKLEFEEEIETEFVRIEDELENSQKREAEAKAREEEERRQKEEAKAKLHSTIKKLKISGMEVNEIAEITGETEEEILKILKS